MARDVRSVPGRRTTSIFDVTHGIGRVWAYNRKVDRLPERDDAGVFDFENVT